MEPPGLRRGGERAAVLSRAANDSVRPLSTVEVALKVRPTGAGRHRLDPCYRRWMHAQYPAAVFHLAPLADYDRLVRPADAATTLEALAARLGEEAEREGGYRLAGDGRAWGFSAPFAVGSVRVRALVDFLFAWG